MFPLKRRCLDALYKTIAWVYIDARNLTCLDDEKTKTRYLKHHLGIRVASLPRDSDLAWMPTANPKEMLKMFHRYNLFINHKQAHQRPVERIIISLNLTCANVELRFYVYIRCFFFFNLRTDNEKHLFCLFMFCLFVF